MINRLIKDPDNYERVRSAIAAILTAEQVNQKAQAVSEGEANPALWDFIVYEESFRALDQPDVNMPVVNVWFQRESMNGKAGGSTEQAGVASYNIDVYGFGISRYDVAGQKPGDQMAAFNSHRIASLVRQIIMSSEYFHLGLRGIVEHRNVAGLDTFQPPFDAKSVEHATVTRINFEVGLRERYGEAEVTAELEAIYALVKRKEDGSLYFDSKILGI